MKFKFYVPLMLLILLVMLTVPVLAADGGDVLDEIETLPGLFEFLASGVAGVVFSQWLKKQQWYAGLSSEVRGALAWSLPIVSAMLGKLLLDFVPDTTIALLQPYWTALWVGLTASVTANLNWRADK